MAERPARPRRQAGPAPAVGRERDYRELADSLPLTVFEVDRAGWLTYSNMVGLETFRVTKERLAAGIRVLDMIAPADRERAADDLARILSGEETGPSEYQALRADGTAFPALVVSRAVKRGKRTVGFRGIVADISERVQAETTLRLQAAALDAAANGIMITDRGGTIRWVNRAFSQLTGFSTAEVVGKSPRVLRSGLHDQAFYGFMWRTIAAGGVWQGEVINRRKDGGLYTEEMTITPVRGTGGEITHFIAIKQDASARRRSEHQFRLVFERSPVGIFLYDKGLRITDCNERFATILESGRDLLLGAEMEALADPAILPVLQRTLAGEEGLFEGNYHVATGDAGRWVTLRAAPLPDAHGAIGGGVGIVEDLTERKRMEEQIRQAQRMEAVGKLAGGVAHDFNNLLQGMLSLTHVLRAHQNDPQRLATVIAELEQQVQHGASLTRQLLLFSRRGTARPERLELNEVIARASQLVRRLLRENIAFDLNLADAPLPVAADRGQLEQVVINLVVNAADAMPEGGHLTVRTSATADGRVGLEVTDDGAGIPAAIRGRIFEPFFTTKGEEGTGLGLAVVHGIVTQHGGSIEVASRVGEGTTFRISLPRAPDDESAAAGTAEEPALDRPRGSGERVLVVEDEPAAREGLREMLVMLGYRPEAVGSGAEVELVPAPAPFDVLLTDLILPDLRGTAVASLAQARWPAIKVILMSGYGHDDVIRKDVSAGSLRFLQKPFDMETLARELRRALE